MREIAYEPNLELMRHSAIEEARAILERVGLSLVVKGEQAQAINLSARLPRNRSEARQALRAPKSKR